MNYRKSIPYLIAIASFIIVSLVYFHPVLEGKKIFQSDIQQFIGMSKEVADYRKANDAEPYWTNAAFGGMPTYQLSTYYPHDYVKKLDSLLRFLPHPADYLFLYFFGFFILLSVLKVEYKLAILGSLAFGFSTYLIIILGVGHNAKAHAIAYMPVVLGGILLTFKRKYLLGFLLTTFALALEIQASHIQMTYYLMFLVIIIGLFYLIEAYKNKELQVYFKSISVLIVAAVLAVGLNATSLLATKEFADFSTRSKSELTINPDGKPKEVTSGLNYDYITEYSYGIIETFNLFIPRFTGGANNEKLDKDSHLNHFLSDKIDPLQARDFVKNAPTYWGSQPIVAAPAYIGAVIIFLFVLSLFLVKGPLKKGLVGAIIVALLLSWGKNFSFLTDFFIQNVPLYNKFRAVSSIQVIVELAIPLLAILGLNQFLKTDESKEIKQKALLKSFYITGGIALFFALFGSSLFTFNGLNDDYFDSMLNGISDALISDRKAMLSADSFRTFVLVSLSAAALWLFIKEKIKKDWVIVIFIFLVLVDMISIDKNYVNKDSFVSAKRVEKPFQPTPIDEEILKDNSYYRVANFSVNPMTDGSTSYFHKSIGGYHAAKPGRYQELYDFHIAKNNDEVLNMLNTKYIIFPDDAGQLQVLVNPEINGNAWFVDSLVVVQNANQEIMGLTKINTKTNAVIRQEDLNKIQLNNTETDSLATIQLIEYQPNYLKYSYKSLTEQQVVFSEMYYKNGWNSYVDGKLIPHIRVNYILRGMKVDAGNHTIEFKFEPTVIKKGNIITLVSIGLFGLLTFAGVWFLKKKQQN
ncbi:MAG: YfhO family protein [Flavobacteriaceae bacterium]|nr:YfhO family protein [Flavobacteriaceae bacterium]